MSLDPVFENPFYVLGILPDATRVEVERAGQKLLALASIDAESARTYRTPFGVKHRDEALIRSAIAALRNPTERIRYELWYVNPIEESQLETTYHWNDAFASIHWRGPCTYP
jgi:hypothetical protein